MARLSRYNERRPTRRCLQIDICSSTDKLPSGTDIVGQRSSHERSLALGVQRVQGLLVYFEMPQRVWPLFLPSAKCACTSPQTTSDACVYSTVRPHSPCARVLGASARSTAATATARATNLCCLVEQANFLEPAENLVHAVRCHLRTAGLGRLGGRLHQHSCRTGREARTEARAGPVCRLVHGRQA